MSKIRAPGPFSGAGANEVAVPSLADHRLKEAV